MNAGKLGEERDPGPSRESQFLKDASRQRGRPQNIEKRTLETKKKTFALGLTKGRELSGRGGDGRCGRRRRPWQWCQRAAEKKTTPPPPPQKGGGIFGANWKEATIASSNEQTV